MARSITTPFNVVGGSIGDTRDSNRHIRDKIIDVLVTGKRERSGNAGHGAGIQQLLFDHIDELVLADFKTDASYEISRSVSGVQIIDIRVAVTDDTTATITVYYSTPLSAPVSTTFSVRLPGVLNEETPL